MLENVTSTIITFEVLMLHSIASLTTILQGVEDIAQFL